MGLTLRNPFKEKQTMVDYKQHFYKILELIEKLKFKEDPVLVIRKIAVELATQNYCIIEKLDSLLEKTK